VAALPETALVSMLGRGTGRHLHALAHNRDPRRVRTGTRRRSMGTQHAMGRRGPRSHEALDIELVGLVDRIGRRLRAARRVCRTIALRMRFDDYSRATRSHTLAEATERTDTILSVARGLLAASMPAIRRRGLTLLGITLSNLEDDGWIQLALPYDRLASGLLDATIDDVRERFGSDAIKRGVLIGRAEGISVPLLPD
jgi:DNA polymerase-4